MTGLKKATFAVAAAAIPFVVIVLVEVVLRLAGVGSSYKPFIAVPEHEEYRALNPDYVQHYFTSFRPAVPFNPFHAEKPENSFRVFVVGGSSTAGFPYQFYHGFPERLSMLFREQGAYDHIEIINLGMTAVNSYTLWDLRRAIARQQPDAVVVYAGHNEFYGAFGAASNINSPVNWIWLKRLTLRLKRSVIYSALERAFRSISGRGVDETQRPLMSRVVRDAGIAADGPLYQDVLEQYRQNMTDFVSTFTRKEIPVYVGTVVSNLKDQPPLSDNIEAGQYYSSGRTHMQAGDLLAAREAFVAARDADEIRFRAPTDISKIIRDFAEREGVTIVDVDAAFIRGSHDGIEGDSLFTDHLHPNYIGYDLIARLFYNAMITGDVTGDESPDETIIPDPIDLHASRLQVARLQSSYPFVKNLSPEQEQRRFDMFVQQTLAGGQYADSIALDVVYGRMAMPTALQAAMNHYSSERDTINTLRIYRSALNWQPFSEDLLETAVQYAIENPEYSDYVYQIAAGPAYRTGNQHAINTLAAILLRRGHLDAAERLLVRSERQDPNDPITLFNRARLLVLQGDTLAAREYFQRFRENQ